MKLKVRRIIYIFFILFFLALATVVIFYSQGFQYNLQKNKIEKTGNLILTYRPREANVFLNGQYRLTSTILDNFVRIQRLAPGEYQIEIKQKDFNSWQKKLIIQPELTTFAQDIKLFRSKIQPIKIANNISLIERINDKNKFLLIKKNNAINQITIFDLNSEQEKNIATTTGFIDNVSLSLNGKKLLTKEGFLGKEKKALKQFILYDLEILNKRRINLPAELNLANTAWDQENSDILYYANKNNIYQFDLLSDEEKAILEIGPKQAKINDFIARGNDLFLIISLDNNNYLTKLAKSQLKQTADYNFPLKNENYRFVNSAGLITLLDQVNGQMIVLDENFKEILTDEAKGATWSNERQEKRLLYYNDFEIIIYEQTKNKKNLIARFSQPINQTIWYPDWQHLIITTDKTIKVTELDLRDNVNTSNYDFIDAIANVFVNDEANKIYFLAGRENSNNLYEMTIQ